jgi:SpoVK/Ycf46/Vps4 family AAA+-type ATPase
MIGMKSVSAQVSKLIARAISERQRMDAGLPVEPKTMHMVFTGAPGTGKTTVAEQFGNLYKGLGLVPEGQFIEAKANDLIGTHLGETQTKTQELFDRARGGVLFIDEAYSLVHGDQDMYGKQAVAVLVDEMEKHRNDTVVILAGYPAEMKTMIETNPGLPSRLPTTIHFPSYSHADAKRIFREGFGRKGRYTLAPGADAKISEALHQIDHGNAREVRNLFDEVTNSVAGRNAAYQTERGKRPSTQALSRITPADIDAGLAAYQAGRLESPRKRKTRAPRVAT